MFERVSWKEVVFQVQIWCETSSDQKKKDIKDIVLHTEDSLPIKFLTCLEFHFGQFRAILKKM